MVLSGFMKNFVKNNLKKLIFGAIFLIILILIIKGGGNKDSGISTYQVVKGDVSDSLILSGEARPSEGADMAFSQSGLVDKVYKASGDNVYLGEKIVELDNASLRADLLDAQASLEIARAEAQVSEASTEVDVKNAYAKLLSDDLFAYTKDTHQVSPAPEVSGIYSLSREGEYRISINPSGSASRFSFHYSGLETGDSDIVFYKPVALGKSGLYLKFSEGDATIGDEWVISIPNVQSSSYTSNLNAYKSALANRDAAGSYSVSKDIALAKVKQAEAQVARIVAELNERTLRAPFAGVVSKLDIKKGEIAEANTIVAGVISAGLYEVVVEVPEVDIVNLETNLPADITLDAYGQEVVFKGTLVSIDSAETSVDGVSVYRAKVSFNDIDDRIRSGMTAKVSILKDQTLGVIVVPGRFIEKDENGEFVTVLKDEEEVKTYIETGLRGSDGGVEVKSGVAEGDTLVSKLANK